MAAERRRRSAGLMIAAWAAGAIAPGAWAQTSDEVRALVAEMVADAETRSSLLSNGLEAGHDGAFFIASPDGGLRLSVGGLIQFRYEWNRLRDASDEQGFFLPRTRLWVRGSVTEDITFFIRSQFSGEQPIQFGAEESIQGVMELDRAWIDVSLGEGWGLRMGQQASDFSRENEHAPQDQLGVNASPTDTLFSLGGYKGVRLAHRGEEFRSFLSFSSGARNTNTGFEDPENADYALTFKGDWKIAGEWSRFNDFTSRPGSDFAAMLGAGAHWENGAQFGDPEQTLSAFLAIAEVSLEGDGWNAFASFNYARTDALSTQGEYFDDYGVVVQGGFYATERIEPFARFDMVIPDSRRVERGGKFRTITAGFNYYPFPGTNAAKFSFDVMYMFDSEEDALVQPSNNAGVLASDAGDQMAVRAQFTLVF